MPVDHRKPLAVLSNRVHPSVVERLSEHCRVLPNDTVEALTRDELLQRAADADALMTFMPDRIDEAFLEACPSLRVIAGSQAATTCCRSFTTPAPRTI